MLIKLENTDNKYIIIIPKRSIEHGIYPSRDTDKFYFYYSMGFPEAEKLINVGFKFKVIGNYDADNSRHVLIEKIIGISMDNININDNKWKELSEKYKQKAIVETHQYRKIENKIKELSKDDIEILMNKFIKWEEGYEVRILENNNTLSTSNIFQYIFQVWESLGKDVTKEELNNADNPFLSHAYLYNGYRIEVHCGQGCYYRIFKNNECLFQSY